MFKSFIHSKINIDYVTNMILQVMKKLILIFKDFIPHEEETLTGHMMLKIYQTYTMPFKKFQCKRNAGHMMGGG